ITQVIALRFFSTFRRPVVNSRHIYLGSNQLMLGRHFFRRSLPAAVCLLFGLSARCEDLKSHQCYQDFSTAYEQVKQNIPARFGADWKMEHLPPEIVTELEWITTSSSKLQSQSNSLDSRAFAVHTDDSELETASNWLNTRMSTLEGKQRDLDS